jgi:hypothetical protein
VVVEEWRTLPVTERLTHALVKGMTLCTWKISAIIMFLFINFFIFFYFIIFFFGI